jgi:acetyl esterase/lipase
MTLRSIPWHLPPGTVRLAGGLACLGVAALAVLEAPSWWLFVLALGATEGGHILALAALGFAAPLGRPSRGGRVGVFGLAAALLALSPMIRAARYAASVPARLEAAFGPATPGMARQAPLTAADLVRGAPASGFRQSTVIYRIVDGVELPLELYRPADDRPPAPCVVVFHAGAWQSGSRLDCQALSRYLAVRGYVVASVDYRLLPTYRFPAPQEDAAAALAYLQAHAGELGIDPQRFVLVGRSAGGHIALLHAYTAHDPTIRGVIALYPPVDMYLGHTYPCRPQILDCHALGEQYLGGKPYQVPATYAAATVTNHIGPDTPPTLLIHGSRDEVVDAIHSRILAAQLARAGRPHLLLELPWATHGMDYIFNGPGGQISTYAIEWFLASVVGESDSVRSASTACCS